MLPVYDKMPKDTVVQRENMHLEEKRTHNRRRPRGLVPALCAVILILCAAITLILAPITWNEIFLAASLKDIGLVPSMPPGTLTLSEFESNIVLPKAQHYPPWLTLPLATLVNALAQFQNLAMASSLSLEVLAVRMVSLLLATLACFGALRIMTSKSKKQEGPEESSCMLPLLETTAVCAVILFFARIGAAEQLLVILSLTMLWLRSESLSTRGRSPFLDRACLSAAALLLALSHSTTWIYSIYFAALIYALLYRYRMRWFTHQLTWFATVGVIFFVIFFLMFSSYEGLVHSFTLRWLYAYDMRNRPWGWSGSSILFRIFSVILLLAALRRTLAFLREGIATNGAEIFLLCLTACSGLFLAFFQINPTLEDILLLSGIFFFSGRMQNKLFLLAAPYQPFSSGSFKTALYYADRLVLWLIWAILLSLCVLCIALLASPRQDILPELQAWLAALQHSWSEPVVHFKAFIIAIVVLCILAVFIYFQHQERNDSLLMFVFVLMLHVGGQVRAHCLWEHYQHIIRSIPASHSLLYLPPLEPFVTLHPTTHEKHLVVPAQTADAGLAPKNTVVLVLPAHLSDLCQAMDWKIEKKYGIFATCIMKRGSLWKLVLLN